MDTLRIASLAALLAWSGLLCASPLAGPTYTNFELAMPADGYNDFHLEIDVTDGSPTIKSARGKINGFFNIGNLPTDKTVSKDGSNWTYKWKDTFGGKKGDKWSMGIELNHDNTMKIRKAYWTADGVPQAGKVALPEWRVVGKEDPLGQDPLAYVIYNPFDELMEIADLVFLRPTDDIPLLLEDLASDFSPGQGQLISVGGFSLSPGTQREFFFDGSGGLPLLDPGATLAAQFEANFVGAPAAQAVKVRTQHALSTPSVSWMAFAALFAARALRKRLGGPGRPAARRPRLSPQGPPRPTY